MLASDGQVIAGEIRIRALGIIELLHVLGDDAIPEHPVWDVILHLACEGARVAANATMLIYG